MPTATSGPAGGKSFRMTEQAYLILLSLTPEPLHGYAVIQAVAGLSDGATALGAGTLYGNLDRLSGAGLVEPAGEEVVDGRLRRYYRITDDGRHAAEQETDRLRALAARAQKALEQRGTAPRPTSGRLAGGLA
ncbi:PadR family transcriptional regulator [Oerskovia jenensis]|uniref:DNA-binding PadR family transcriptional regulator n=1 Tax=Oerskovia jenensis TaxID=162169 RepID=A0ABS2LEL3_9CELL|nr:PadR family transcriptional regulator [Oerskovia jenensis]MBM7478866.1 DNA-binding PadR family transcriptional regulator [Oerskovia jenensis]